MSKALSECFVSNHIDMKLTDNQRERYSRMLALRDFTEENMQAIMKTTVTVVGAGGLGSPALRLLAAIGFGTIRIIDRDIVELSNIQRQTIYNTEDIGKPKALVAATNLALMNPEVKYEPFSVSIQEENVVKLLDGTDIILDGLDSFKARRVINKASLELKAPYIFAGAVEYYANLSTFIPGKTGCLHCLMGDAEDNPDNTCAQVGVSPTLLSLAAAVEVNEAILLATGNQPALANRLMTIDSTSLSFDFFDIGRVPNCPQCSQSAVRENIEGNGLTVTALCSESFNISPRTILDLNLEEIAKNQETQDTIKAGKKFLIIQKPSGAKITLMNSGSAIIKGASTADEAVQLYKEVLKNSD
jgi:molybdopterin/thiamine biosynthesis adenylyltransferase